MTYSLAIDRPDDEPCEKGTVGCCVVHDITKPETNCEPW